jgi:hypothetical protein
MLAQRARCPPVSPADRARVPPPRPTVASHQQPGSHRMHRTGGTPRAHETSSFRTGRTARTGSTALLVATGAGGEAHEGGALLEERPNLAEVGRQHRERGEQHVGGKAVGASDLVGRERLNHSVQGETVDGHRCVPRLVVAALGSVTPGVYGRLIRS